MMINTIEKFNERQIKQIALGLQYKIDTAIYAKSEFNWRQME